MLIQQLVNGLMLGSVYALVAVAFTLTIGVLNFLNFSISGLFMIGGLVFWALTSHTGMGILVAMPVALLVAGVASLAIERLAYAWTKSSDHEVPLVSSLGFLILFEELAVIAFGSDSQTMTAHVPDLSLRLGGVVIGGAQATGLLLSIAIVAVLSVWLGRTQMGRAVRAVSESPVTAQVLGVNLDRIVPLIFLLTGLIAAMGGILFAINYGQVSPFMGDEIGMKAIAAMIVGGMGALWGGVIGGLLIGLVETLALYLFGSDVVDIVVYGLLLVLLVLRPYGLLGAQPVKEKL